MTAVSFAALGDAPYRKSRDDARFAALLQSLDGLGPAFIVHLGDIKRGTSPCKTKRYKEVRKLLAEVESPIVYTPGDNDWADCFKKKSGDYDPRERLRKIRALFFEGFADPSDQRLGIVRQARRKENARWNVEDVAFLSLHIVGTNNNLDRDPKEFRKRNRDNLAWLEAGFESARASRASAMVILTHANLWHPSRGKLQKGFKDCLALLAEQAGKFGKPVLVAHGDKHRLIVDQPFASLDNVTRLQVMGDDELGAVMVRVQPREEEAFQFEVLEPPV